MAKPKLPRLLKIFLLCTMIAVLLGVIGWYLSTLHIAMLDPKGIIALKERNLMAFTVLLGLIVIIPVFIMTIAIAWRYREGNTKAAYTPNWSTNWVAESIWWGIPITLILIMSIVTWKSSYDLDPYKPLHSSTQAITIKVVALDWKWLFIYPDQGIATVNLVQFPTDTPINFDLTADAPMNSFWIPQLSGQLYAMPGMTTKLHLNATEDGDYKGSSANISGSGFAGMKFVARASSKADFDAWVKTVKQSPTSLSLAEYDKLAAQSKNNPVSFYNSSVDNLYDTIVMKYMMPATKNDSGATPSTTMDHSTMDMNMKMDMN